MALRGDVLYVADRKNHLIRALDLRNHTVSTVAGTGRQESESRESGGAARAVGLNSPWDLCSVGQTLYVAMAGHHQIWALDLLKQTIFPFAGDGRENIADGPRSDASFAQPSGLATDGKTLFVADSEVSAIRAIPLDGSGLVRTIVGTGLFDFGDVDDTGDRARLQHALGVAYGEGRLYVADTYNSKIKLIDPSTRRSLTLAGGKGGWLAGPVLNEPGGLSVARGKLYIADTNGHRIRTFDLRTHAMSTLPLKDVPPPAGLGGPGSAPGTSGH
jgi:DNA-binding beta-propeller fold protein YncE